MKSLFYILTLFSSALLAQDAKAQTSAADNKISESVTFREMAKGPSVYGIFEGRSPCDDFSRRMDPKLPADLDHLKWQLILFQDSVTKQPTTYSLVTEMFGRKPQEGKWTVIKDVNNNLSAPVIALERPQPYPPLYLLKGDENVFFILDDHQHLMTGDKDFSYTLNRVRKVLHLTGQ
ncbi:MAG: hypothetical protein ACXVIY_07135 [Mucilaginibacter sp.]